MCMDKGNNRSRYLTITKSVYLNASHLYAWTWEKIAHEYLIMTNSVYLHLYLEFICIDIGENSSRIPNYNLICLTIYLGIKHQIF